MARFKPGQSGNPGGRPKLEAEVRELCRHYTRESVEKLVEWMRSDNARGSIMAARELLDRAWGKPAQDVSLSGSVGMTLEEMLIATQKP